MKRKEIINKINRTSNIFIQLLFVVIGTLTIAFFLLLYFIPDQNPETPDSDFPNWLTLLVEIAVGFGIAIIINFRTKQSEIKVKKTLDDINSTSTKIDTAVAKIEEIEKQQQDFLEKEKSERNKRKDYGYSVLQIEFVHIKRYFKNLQNISNQILKSDEHLAHQKEVSKRTIDAILASAKTIRNTIERFRLDLDFNHQINIARFISNLEVDCSFIETGSHALPDIDEHRQTLDILVNETPNPQEELKKKNVKTPV